MQVNDIEIWLPSGPINDIGWAENVYGDANFIIKKDIFNKLGGFTTDRGIGNEDWEFLAKASLASYRQTVIVRPLVHYRVRKDSMLRTHDLIKSRKRVLRVFDEFTSDFGELFTQTIYPIFDRGNNSKIEYGLNGWMMLNAFKKVGDRYAPVGSQRRKIIIKVILWLAK